METSCVYYRNQWQSDLICSWLFSSHGVWGQEDGGCLAVGFIGRGHLPLLSSWREQDIIASPCPYGWISHARAGWCFCAHSPHWTWLWERRACGAGVAVLPQSCSWPRAGVPGRDGSTMRLPEQSPLPLPDHCPSQGSLKLNAKQAAYSVVPGVIFLRG